LAKKRKTEENWKMTLSKGRWKRRRILSHISYLSCLPFISNIYFSMDWQIIWEVFFLLWEIFWELVAILYHKFSLKTCLRGVLLQCILIHFIVIILVEITLWQGILAQVNFSGPKIYFFQFSVTLEITHLAISVWLGAGKS